MKIPTVISVTQTGKKKVLQNPETRVCAHALSHTQTHNIRCL